MTAQITVKLNEEKFDPLISHLLKRMCGVTDNASDLVGRALFFYYLYFNQKLNAVNKTRAEVIKEMSGESNHSVILNVSKEYARFKEEGILRHHIDDGGTTLHKFF